MLHFANWKIVLIAAVSLGGIVFAMPNVFGPRTLAEFPSFLPSQTVNLGLDLRGGSHLLLEVDTAAVIAERLEAVVDDVRSTLRDARIRYTGLRAGDRSVVVRVTDQGRVDEAVSLIEDLAAPVTTNVLAGVGSRDLEVEAGGDNFVTVRLTEPAIEQRIFSAVDQSIEIVRRRIDELGTTEPTIQRQGADRILVQVPGLDDPARLKALIGQTAKLTFRLVDVTARAEAPPAGSEVVYDDSSPPQPYVLRRRVVVSGENLVDAQPAFDQQTNEPIVTFRFDSSGARRFGQVTQENVGRPFAIVLDNKVISAPVIREPILGGSGQISGSFTVEGANDLAILLRAGALPAPLTILEERTVGPGLGADSIAAGEVAAVIGLVAVVVFMVVAYGLFGLFSDIALFINIALILGVLSLLQATLTLPGIAGIVLTIGMAVDANVLIYERIREETREGKSPISAIEAGYRRALGTILDANITTFIAAAILFQMGSGPVRGFAVTLAIGVVTSVFTAFTVTRLMVATWVRRRRPGVVPI
jgi:protein-export membrane protein SecD